MTAQDVLVHQLETAHFLFDKFIKDFSETDAHYQPGGKGNHAAWILMHLAVSVDHLVGIVDGQGTKLSKQLHEKYNGGSTCIAEDGLALSDAWKAFVETNQRAIECVKKTPPARYAESNPTGSKMFPTIGSLISIIASHPYWHFGQLTVNRTLLSKPRLLGA